MLRDETNHWIPFPPKSLVKGPGQIPDVLTPNYCRDDTDMTEGSFVKIAHKKGVDEDALDGKDDSEPDVYDVNVVAWDTPVSPLHLAIIGGHTKVINTLISTFGADALLPIKIIDEYSRSPKHAIMTLVLAAGLPSTDALQVTHALLASSASSAQADNQRISAFHYLVAKEKVDLLKASVVDDGAATRSALNHLVLEDTYWRPSADTPLTTAIKTGNTDLVQLLLDMGAKPSIDLDDYTTAHNAVGQRRSYYHNNQDVAKLWRENVRQPIFLAVVSCLSSFSPICMSYYFRCCQGSPPIQQDSIQYLNFLSSWILYEYIRHLGCQQDRLIYRCMEWCALRASDAATLAA